MSETAASEPRPEIVFETLTAYQQTAALRAAIELGVFGALKGGPATAAQLAQRCDTSLRGMRILCDYLTILGLLTKTNEMYGHSPTSQVFLDPASEACIATTVRFMSLPQIREPFEQLTEVVRRGGTVLPGAGTVEEENPIWVEFAESMAPMMAGMAGSLATLVSKGRTGSMRVLDIAAGHGLFGIAFAKENPAARVVAVDWAPVLAVAEDNARKAGVAERFEKKPGSAFDVEYGGPYDVALLTNFLHHFDAATCIGLLKKVRAALRPGGTAATLEFVPNEDRVSPPVAAKFSITMLATTAAGDAYTFKELEAMHREAGFREVTAHSLPTGPGTAVLAVAP